MTLLASFFLPSHLSLEHVHVYMYNMYTASQHEQEYGDVYAVLTGRHLSQSTRDLSESLSPSRGGVCHHTHVVAHVPEILGERDA